MPPVDFYILPAENQHAQALFACRLIEKAYHKGHHIWVFTENAERQEALAETKVLLRMDPNHEKARQWAELLRSSGP